MTTQQIRDEAIEAAKHARDTHGVPNSGCDDDLTFEECGGVCCILARYVLDHHAASLPHAGETGASE